MKKLLPGLEVKVIGCFRSLYISRYRVPRHKYDDQREEPVWRQEQRGRKKRKGKEGDKKRKYRAVVHLDGGSETDEK
jgi:hypothetical protein